MTVIYGGNMAFPIPNTGHGAPFDEGMSLRDYIAIHAMQGMFSSGNLPKSVQDDELANVAYEMADAMLKARVEGEQ
jgi:hypothetical protein